MFLRFLHRLLEIFLHVERRFEQPFLRPALDAALPHADRPVRNKDPEFVAQP